MKTALERGLGPDVAGCLSQRATYGHCYFFTGAADLSLVTFAVENRIVGPKQAEVAVAAVLPAIAHRSGRRVRKAAPSFC